MSLTMRSPLPPPTAISAPRQRGDTDTSADADAGSASPPWTRVAYVVLLAGTAVLYLWGLGASGWANSFYSAAVQAGSESWKAFFFGASDAANSITVDKTPLALWPMALSVRLFGLNSWSILVPQALAGVATVALLHRLVRRSTGSAVAGLIAGLTMALTPVAVLMFRFNNPDALLVLLMVAASAATLRAVRHSGEPTGHPVRWIALGGALVGVAFLTKMLQAFLVLPALALVYLLFAQTSWGKRIGHLLIALGSMILAGGWWLAIVEWWPAASRPYIGGSQHNSILELTLGYNGLGRLSGNETGSVGGGNGWGTTGLGRMFSTSIGDQIAWLLPAALVLGVAGLVLARGREVRQTRAAATLWLTWLVVTGLTFSFMAGIFHGYYTVALAPAIAALVGIGGVVCWQRRDTVTGASVLAFTMSLTTVFGFMLMGRSTDFLPWLRWVVLVTGLIAAILLATAALLPRAVVGGVAVLALTAGLAGPAAWSVQTAMTPHTGSIVTAGPTSTGGPGAGAGGPGGTPPAGLPAQTGQQPGTGQASAGGLLSGSSSSTAIDALLRADAADYTWVAAAIGSNSAAGYQLSTELPVMAVGGFNGSDPSPTLAQFQEWVAQGKIHYFIGSGNGMGGGPAAGNATTSEIATWVSDHFTASTVDGVTLYDLSTGVTA